MIWLEDSVEVIWRRISQMATAKVHHDQGDMEEEEQEFAEIDRILAQAKQQLHRDRCRDRKLMRLSNRNLSDIPENFAHVPSASSEPPSRSTTRPVSLDMSQPDLASRRDVSRPPRHYHKLHVLGLMAPMKWLRGYMGCLMVAHHHDDHVRRSAQRQRWRVSSKP